MLKRLLLVLTVSVAVGTGFMGLGTSKALACTEYGVFWSDTAPSYEYGARGNISLTNHTPSSCDVSAGDKATGQTSRVLLDGLSGYYVESGWAEVYCGAASGNYSGDCFYAFMEWSIAGSGSQWTSSSPWGCLAPGNYYGWQTDSNLSNSTNFDGWVDCGTGQNNWSYLHTFNVSPYSNGIPDGEGFHHDSTSMGETHNALKWRDGPGNWFSSSDVWCRYDTDPSWNGNKLSSTSWNIVSSGGTSC
jgi:hypothetical protein